MGYGAGWFARKPAKKPVRNLEENQQNKQSEIPQEDLKESWKKSRKISWKKTCQQAGLKTGRSIAQNEGMSHYKTEYAQFSNLGLTSLPENLPPHLIEFTAVKTC